MPEIAPRTPAAVMVIDGLVRRVSHRQPAPLASGIDDEEDGLEDIERVMPSQGRTHRWEDEPQHRSLILVEAGMIKHRH